jgi:hypothetical protein
MMAWVFSWILCKLWSMPPCSDCTYRHGWEDPVWVMGSTVMALGFSGALGWIVYAVVWMYHFRIMSASYREGT